MVMDFAVERREFGFDFLKLERSPRAEGADVECFVENTEGSCHEFG